MGANSAVKGGQPLANMIKSHPKLDDNEQAAKEAFMLYDTSGDEKLDVKEIGQLLRALGMTPTHLQVRDIVREFDKDKNGTIEFNEFLDLYAAHKAPAASSKELLEAFAVFDKQGTGSINVSDLTEALTTLGDPMPEVQVKELIATLNPTDGKISIEEFVAFLTK